VVQFVIRAANEPAKRFRILWYFMAWSVAILYIAIGSGYLASGDSAIKSKTLNLVKNIEQNFHVHGAIMVGFGAFLIYGLNDYRRATRIALIAVFIYSLWVAVLIIGGWFLYPISWGAPWWYFFTASISGGLIVLAPPLNKDGRRYKGPVRIDRA
jgi:hypothetical protein